MLTSCTLPWTSRNSADTESLRDDSAFHEPEYASPQNSLEHGDYANGVVIRRLSKLDLESSFVPPDYEEVDPLQVQQLRQALSNKMNKDKKTDNNTQRIMKSLIYCIHKVRFLKDFCETRQITYDSLCLKFVRLVG